VPSRTPDDLKAGVAASREACELLRKMTEPARALFSYDSAASHTDPHLRDIAWRRENAVLAFGVAASLAQLIFART
jgi:hypothetical protein